MIFFLQGLALVRLSKFSIATIKECLVHVLLVQLHPGVQQCQLELLFDFVVLVTLLLHIRYLVLDFSFHLNLQLIFKYLTEVHLGLHICNWLRSKAICTLNSGCIIQSSVLRRLNESGR